MKVIAVPDGKVREFARGQTGGVAILLEGPAGWRPEEPPGFAPGPIEYWPYARLAGRNQFGGSCLADISKAGVSDLARALGEMRNCVGTIDGRGCCARTDGGFDAYQSHS